MTGRSTEAAGHSVPEIRNVGVRTQLEPEREKGVKTDLELLEAFRNGDERAYAELYVRRKSEIYTFCMRMLDGDGDAAGDAFQETFIKVYEKADSFREGTNVLGWLYMIARNTCLNMHRSKRSMEPLAEYQELESRDRRLDPEFREEQGFLRYLLEHAILQLPREFREPFILREFDGFSYSEIAKLTDATLGVTKVRIHRAKQKMRELLRPYLRDGAGDGTLFADGNLRGRRNVEEDVD